MVRQLSHEPQGFETPVPELRATPLREPLEADKDGKETTVGGKGEEDTPPEPEFTVPWLVRWISLTAVIAMPIGVNWASASLSPLRNTLRNELGINNQQFGVISAGDAIVNTIWPLIGGIFLDWMGVNATTPFCTGIILIGSVLSAVGVRIGNWRLLTGGYILQGFGTALLDSCQQVFFHAFGKRSGLAFAFALEAAVATATAAAARAAAIPIRDRLGTEWVFWVPVFFCLFSCIVNAVYIWYSKRIMPQQYRVTSGRERAAAEGKSAKKFNLDSLWLLPWCFWMLPATQLLQSGAAGGFDLASADIIRLRGYTEATAGFLQSGSLCIRVLLGPIFGYCVDRWCHRFHYVALAPLLWITACSLLGFTSVHPMVALVFSSLAGVINSSPLQMALHLLVADHRLIGTAFGVWRAFNNSGSTVIDVSFGRIQDNTPGQGYDQVLKTAIGIKAWAFALGIGYIIVDHRYLGAGLTMTRARRNAIEAKITDPASHPITRRTPVKWVTYASLGLMVAFIIVAWVLFFLGLAE